MNQKMRITGITILVVVSLVIGLTAVFAARPTQAADNMIISLKITSGNYVLCSQESHANDFYYHLTNNSALYDASGNISDNLGFFSSFGPLLPGHGVTLSHSVTIRGGTTVIATAVATFDDPAGTQYTISGNVTVADGNCTITLVKTASPTEVCQGAGTPVTYTYTITNDSVFAWKNFCGTGCPALSDDKLGTIQNLITLGPGQSGTYTKTATVNDTTTNTASAQGEFTDPSETTGSATANATVTAKVCAPTTTITLDPATPNGCNGWYISPVRVTLSAQPYLGGPAVDYTQYSLDGGTTWTQCPPNPLTFTVSAQGTSTVLAYSVDNAGNVETPKSATFKIDSVPPTVNIVAPANGATIKDTFTFTATATDATSGVQQVQLFIRQDDGSAWGKPMGYGDLPMTYNSATGHWEYALNTNNPDFPDGCYLVFAHVEDNACNWQYSNWPVHFTIHNWVVTRMGSLPWFPAAGVLGNYQFSVKVSPSVDPRQPNVSSQGLVVKIFATRNPGNILQTSTYSAWPSVTNYWIDPMGVYHVEFQSSTMPMQYTVAVYSKCGSLIGTFTFSTSFLF